MSDELHYSMRSQTLRGVVQALDDSGPSQTITVQLHFGQVRSKVPVHQAFGFSSVAPLDGAITHVVQNGADPSDVVALPVANPAAARMGGLETGEAVLYDAAGQKVYLRNGKIVQIDALSEMVVSVGGKTVLDLNQNGAAITGSLTVSEGIKAGGDVVAGSVSLQSHVHSGVETGSGETGEPQ